MACLCTRACCPPAALQRPREHRMAVRSSHAAQDQPPAACPSPCLFPLCQQRIEPLLQPFELALPALALVVGLYVAALQLAYMLLRLLLPAHQAAQLLTRPAIQLAQLHGVWVVAGEGGGAAARIWRAGWHMGVCGSTMTLRHALRGHHPYCPHSAPHASASATASAHLGTQFDDLLLLSRAACLKLMLSARHQPCLLLQHCQLFAQRPPLLCQLPALTQQCG